MDDGAVAVQLARLGFVAPRGIFRPALEAHLLIPHKKAVCFDVTTGQIFAQIMILAKVFPCALVAFSNVELDSLASFEVKKKARRSV